MKLSYFLLTKLIVFVLTIGLNLSKAQEARSKRKIKKQEQNKSNNTSNNTSANLSFVKSKSSLTGKVIDANTGEPLIGVTVKIKELNVGTQTDLEGNFIIPNLDTNSPFTVEFHYISYQTKELTNLILKPSDNKPIIVSMEEQGVNVEEVVITEDVRKESDASAQLLQKLNIRLMDVFSGDMILQSSTDLFMATSINRMPGIALIEDKFLTIRGLPERYNGILFNGFPLPVMNVERQTFDFNNLFSSFISQVQLVKSSTADQFGNLGGGIVRFETPGMPSKNEFVANIISGYNFMASFQKQILPLNQNKGLLGFMSSPEPFLPKNFPEFNEFQPIASNPNNPQLAEYGKTVQADFLTTQKNALPNLYFYSHWKKRIELGPNKFLGWTLGLNTSNINTKETLDLNVLAEYSPGLGYSLVADYSNSSIYKRQQISSFIANLAFQSEKFILNFKNTALFNYIGRNIDMYGNYYDLNNLLTPYRRMINRFEKQMLYSSQIQTEYLLNKKEKKELKISGNLFFNYANSNNPFYYTINTLQNESNNQWYFSDQVILGANALLFMNMQSSQQDRMLGAEWFALYTDKGEKIKWNLKGGFYFGFYTKNFNARNIGFLPGDSLKNSPVIKEQIIDNQQFIFNQNIIAPNYFYLTELTDDKDNFRSKVLNIAPYIQSEINISKLWSFLIGVRLDTYSEYLENTTLAGSVVPFREKLFINPLPSLSLARHLSDKMNLKLGISQTIIRSDTRELSYFKFFDRQTLSEWEGNPELKPTQIFNTDLRFEYFPQGIDMLTITPFFKYLKDPIEQTVSPTSGSGVYFNKYTLSNAGAAISYGIEIEFRKRFSYEPENYFSNLSIYGNLTLLNSVVTKENEQLQGIRANRRLQGLSPLLSNLGILFKEPKTGIGFDVFYNRFGRQIVVVGKPGQFNDLVVLPRDRMDIQISKNFKDKILLRFIIQDVFNQPFYRVQFYENNIHAKFKDARLNTRYMQGRLFTLSLNYKI
jgi:hypothetical protein